MIHGIGGNIIGFDALVKRLGPNQPVYALQSQGLDGIRPHLTTIEEMAAHYISEIRVVQPRGPYYLLGYSFGGLVAFEMAQQLQTSGEEVGLLGMLDSFQLTYLQAKSKLSSEAFARYKDKLVAHTRAVLFGPNRRLYIQDGLRRQYNHLFRKLARGGGEAPVPGPFSIIHMANEVAGRNYRPLPYSGKITMFRAQIRPPFEQYDRTLGWTGLASEIEVIDVPGDHISMGEEPNAAMLAAALDRCMSQTVAVLNVLTTSAGQ